MTSAGQRQQNDDLGRTNGGSAPKPPGYLEPADDQVSFRSAVQAGTPMTAPGDATRLSAFVPGRSRLLILLVATATPRNSVDTPAEIREHAISGIIACRWV